MILEFSTKRDTCGNTYTLVLDTKNKTYNTNRLAHKSDIKITRKQRQELIEKAKEDGYKEV